MIEIALDRNVSRYHLTLFKSVKSQIIRTASQWDKMVLLDCCTTSGGRNGYNAVDCLAESPLYYVPAIGAPTSLTMTPSEMERDHLLIRMAYLWFSWSQYLGAPLYFIGLALHLVVLESKLRRLEERTALLLSSPSKLCVRSSRN
jgi:hypothetical protein